MPLPIPIIRYLLYKHFLFCFFFITFVSYDVDELTSKRVNKLLEKKTKEL